MMKVQKRMKTPSLLSKSLTVLVTTTHESKPNTITKFILQGEMDGVQTCIQHLFDNCYSIINSIGERVLLLPSKVVFLTILQNTYNSKISIVKTIKKRQIPFEKLRQTSDPSFHHLLLTILSFECHIP